MIKGRVLVTGGAGFIGSHLTEALVQQGCNVTVLDNLNTGTLDNLKSIRNKINFIKGDIRDIDLLKKALKKIDYVFHQAALRSIPKSIDNPLEFHEVNVLGTLQMLLACRHNKVKRVVYASSSSVYGAVRKLPINEEMNAVPISPYSVSKLGGEMYCRYYWRLSKLPVVILRYFNVFGPRQPLESKYAMAIPKFITCLLKRESPPIHGDGTQTRDFTYVKDIVKANLLAIRSKQAEGHIFNVGSGINYSVLALVDTLKSLLQKNVEPIFIPWRRGDVPHTLADITKAAKFIKYKPAYKLREALKPTAEYFDNIMKKDK